MPNDIGDLIIADNRVGVGVSENLSTFTVRAKGTVNLSGTVAKTNGSATLTGTSTSFLSQLGVGDRITVPGGATETRTVTAIASETSLTVDSNFLNTATGQTASVSPSALRVDETGGRPQVVFHSLLNPDTSAMEPSVGIGTMVPAAQLHVSGPGVGDLFGCPVGLRVHMKRESDPWPLVLSTVGNDDADMGVLVWVSEFSGDGGATMTFSVFHGEDIVQDFLTIDGNGLMLQCAFRSVTNNQGTGDYTIQPHDHYVLKDAGTGCTVTLPAAGDMSGRELYIHKAAGSGTITVAAASGDQINGVATKQITTTYAGLKLVSNGGDWIATVVTAA